MKNETPGALYIYTFFWSAATDLGQSGSVIELLFRQGGPSDFYRIFHLNMLSTPLCILHKVPRISMSFFSILICYLLLFGLTDCRQTFSNFTEWIKSKFSTALSFLAQFVIIEKLACISHLLNTSLPTLPSNRKLKERMKYITSLNRVFTNPIQLTHMLTTGKI